MRIKTAFLALCVGLLSVPACLAVSTQGFFEGVSIFLASGWGVDGSDPTNSCAIELYADGTSTNGNYLGEVETEISRPDVNTALGITGNHGFNFALPLSLLDGTNHTLYAYVKTAAGNLVQLNLLSPFTGNLMELLPPEIYTNVPALWIAPQMTNQLPALFTDSNNWPTVQARISAIKLPDLGLLNAAGSWMSAGDVSNMVSKLKEWGIPLAFESGAIKEWGCDATNTFPVTQQAINLIRTNGGTVKYIAMDEPLVQETACGYTDTGIEQETAKYVNLIKSANPGIIVGDIEPWPYFSEARLLQWIDGFQQQAGYPLAFFHLDVDLAAVRQQSTNLTLFSDLTDLKAQCAARGIPFGVILWQANVQLPVQSDEDFYNNATYWAALVQSYCQMDVAIIQSWEYYPDQTVPETTPYTFTYLARNYIQNLANVSYPAPGVSLVPLAQPGLAISGRTGTSYSILSKGVLNSPEPWNLLDTITLLQSTDLWMDPAGYQSAARFYQVAPTNSP